MSQFNLPNLTNTGLLGIVCGSLLVAPLAISAEPVFTPNRCSGINGQEPGNSRVLVPEGCRSNVISELQQDNLSDKPPMSGTDDSLVPAAQPPLPETQTPAIATITPRNNKVDVRLENTTNAAITYQVVGHTEQRSLTGGQQKNLTQLPLPVTLTVVRQDGGLIDITPKTSKSGMLEVILNEDPKLDSTQGTIRIEKDGQVFVN